MPYLPTAQSWLENSTLLLSARPTTTRITTKYTIVRPSPPAHSSTTDGSKPPAQPVQSKADLVLKTYDPVSGTCLKYRTNKAAEMGRLVAALGRCGRVMAALPEKEEEMVGLEGGEKEVEETKESKASGKDGKAGQGKAGAGGGGKKKKGKKSGGVVIV